MADNTTTENAKKQLAEERKVTEKSRAEYAQRTKGKPTPTQEENDLAVLGAHITEHEDDGSGPDPHHVEKTKQLEADKSGTKPAAYQTRQATPATPAKHE
jgi:hypothetical protein